MTVRTRRHDRYRPDRLSPEESAELREFAAVTAGRYPCDWPDCPNRARERFAGQKLCPAHTTEAMAVAYAMETGGAY